VNATTVINSAFVPVPVKLLIDVETVMRFGFSRCSNKIKYLQIILTIIWVKVLVVM
jgi:hypothetical protein